MGGQGLSCCRHRLFNKEVIGYAMADHFRTELVTACEEQRVVASVAVCGVVGGPRGVEGVPQVRAKAASG